MDQLSLSVGGEGLRVGGESSRVPAVVTRVLTLEVGWAGVVGVRSEPLGAVWAVPHGGPGDHAGGGLGGLGALFVWETEERKKERERGSAKRVRCRAWVSCEVKVRGVGDRETSTEVLQACSTDGNQRLRHHRRTERPRGTSTPNQNQQTKKCTTLDLVMMVWCNPGTTAPRRYAGLTESLGSPLTERAMVLVVVVEVKVFRPLSTCRLR